MAFKSVKGVEVRAVEIGTTFLIADYFTILRANDILPAIFSWSEVRSIRENKRLFHVSIRGGHSYTLKKSWFADNEDLLLCRAIMESYAGQYGFHYSHLGRLLPHKKLYGDFLLPDRTISATSKYDENDLIEAAHALQSHLYLRHLWVLAFVTWAGTIVWFGQQAAVEVGWIITVAASLGLSSGAALFVYAVLRRIQTWLVVRLFKHDVAATAPLHFIVCRSGIAVIEEVVGFYNELIPWSFFHGYIETQTTLLFVRNGRAIVRLPFRALSREQEAWIRNMLISIGLPEKGK